MADIIITPSQIENTTIKRIPWLDYVFRPAVVLVMLGCLSWSLINFVRLINPAWNGLYFFTLMLLVSLEGIYSYRMWRYFRPRSANRLRARLIELGLILLAVKIISYANTPWADIGAELQALSQNPMLFFNAEFSVLAILVTLAWVAASSTMHDFELLYDPYTYRQSYRVPIHRLALRFFWGGGIIIFLSGLSYTIIQYGLSGLADINRPSSGGIILNVLLYFLLGLMLLSQIQLTNLLTSWQLQKAIIKPDLAKNWILTGLILLLVLTGLAFLLPTNYSLGFLDTVRVGTSYIMGVLYFISQLFLFLLTVPLMFLMSLFSGEGGGPPPPPPPPPPQFVPSHAQSGWWEFVRSLFFWATLLGLGFYLIKSYLADNPELVAWLKQFTVFHLVVRNLSRAWLAVLALVQRGLALMPRASNTQEEALSTPASKKTFLLAVGVALAKSTGVILLFKHFRNGPKNWA